MRNVNACSRTGFTLIELLVVITILAVLFGFLFPVFTGVQDRARKVQAKNDLTQIVTAINAYYTEYGKYPLPTSASGDAYSVGGATGPSSKGLFDALRGLDPTLNPRRIAFINPPDAKDQSKPSSGMGSSSDGKFYDPWGFPYRITIDSNYNDQLPNPYGANNGAGANPLRQGVVTLSIGKDGALGKAGKFTGSDDVISWQ